MRAYSALTEKFKTLSPVLNEPARRLWAAPEALALGRGGVSAAARATGLSRPTIYAGMEEIHTGTVATPRGSHERVRRLGGGRKQRIMHAPTLRHDLEALVEPTTRGDPQSPLRWTCKSVRKLAAARKAQGHLVSPQLVSALLHAADSSLQGARKTREGGQHPDRNAPFEPLNARVQDLQRRGQPVISVDAKKKELLGDCKHAGGAWHPTGHPPEVRVDDCVDEALGKAIPSGVYDVGANLGWVSVGVDHDTAACAVATIRAWWGQMGAAMSPRAKELLITADGGGSHRARARLWKAALQRRADATGRRMAVSHLPPGTSKWHKIAHRMFCHSTANWRGQPRLSREVIVSLIGRPRSATGLRIQAALDAGQYPIGIKGSAVEMEAIRLARSDFHGEWNSTILPHKRPRARRGSNALM